MDATQREMTLVSIHNALAEGYEPLPHADDSQEVRDLYQQEVSRWKIAYGRQRGFGVHYGATQSPTDGDVLAEVLQFEQTYGISVIEVEHARKLREAEFQKLPSWERAPETWMAG
jgi:hypothetical protein